MRAQSAGAIAHTFSGRSNRGVSLYATIFVKRLLKHRAAGQRLHTDQNQLDVALLGSDCQSETRDYTDFDLVCQVRWRPIHALEFLRGQQFSHAPAAVLESCLLNYSCSLLFHVSFTVSRREVDARERADYLSKSLVKDCQY
jgi:hypothetical protein